MKKFQSKIKIGIVLVMAIFCSGCAGCDKAVNPLAPDSTPSNSQGSPSGPNSYGVWLGSTGVSINSAQWALGSYNLQTSSGSNPDQGLFGITTVCPTSSPEGNLALLTLNMETTGINESGDINLIASGGGYSSFNLSSFDSEGHIQFDAFNQSGSNSKTITIQWGNNAIAANLTSHWIGGGAVSQASYSSVALPTLSGWNHYSIALASPSQGVSASVLAAINEVIVTLSSSGAAGAGNSGDVFIDNLQFTAN